MIVFQKDSEGWKRTGDQLPTEMNAHMQILVDADSKPLNGLYKYPEAIKLVEDAIAKGAGDHYRYEMVSASAKALSRAGIKAQPKPRPAKKTSAPAKPKATTKSRYAGKSAPNAKKETGAQRRARLKAAGLCTACGTRKAAPKPKAQGGGHYSECSDCREYYNQWAKDHAKKAAKRGAR